jgi:hypothetical protein
VEPVKISSGPGESLKNALQLYGFLLPVDTVLGYGFLLWDIVNPLLFLLFINILDVGVCLEMINNDTTNYSLHLMPPRCAVASLSFNSPSESGSALFKIQFLSPDL